ncbi:MAG: hypothetical protein L3J76_04305 [Candidatus Hydrothermae bacterium]|nr:hypothetical protein [Candidatus Hydrothermae bacterium]
MNPTFWVVVDEEGLVVLHAENPSQTDTEFLATTIFFGYISLRQALEGELQTRIREIILPTSRYLLMLSPLSQHLLLIAVFPSDTALGMARVELKRLSEIIEKRLRELQTTSVNITEPTRDSRTASQESPAQSIQERWSSLQQFIRTRTPDPAFVIKRLSLRTGIPERRLLQGDLTPEELHRVETHIKTILGITRLDVS